MSSFRDKSGKVWTFGVIDAPTIRRIRTDIEGDPEFLKADPATGMDLTPGRLFGDPVLLCRVLYLLCEPQCHAEGVPIDKFYLQVIGESLREAGEALMEDLKAFAPGCVRKGLEAYTQKRELQEKLMEMTRDKVMDPVLMEELSKEIAEKFDKLRQRTSSSSASNLPDLSGADLTD